MEALYGIEAPPGEGMVVEVHLDIMDAPLSFLDRLSALGFESDPFLDFYPPMYRFHYTGRTRAASIEVRKKLPGINELVARVIQEAQEAGVKLYAETELVRETHYFEDDGSPRDLSALENVAFAKSRDASFAKADVHVEFRSGTVAEEVRALLVAKAFYWVRTPASKRFPSEEIATLQTSSYFDARQIYERIVAAPLPGCTGIHLEQKLGMTLSHPALPLPEIVERIEDADGGIRLQTPSFD